MDDDLSFLLVAAFGAFTQEVLYWFDLKDKFHTKRFQGILRSRQVWLITLLMIFVSSLGTWILYGERSIPRDLQFILGAAFPLIFKKLVSAVGRKDEPNLGASSIKDYFELLSFKGTR